VTDIEERGAIVSGIGISSIGRKTGLSDLDLTVEASSAAITDAGLTTGDIDGIATMGDTAPEDVEEQLRITAAWSGSHGSGGLLAPVMGAFVAVARGHARHVLVYRTVKMMGGSMLPREEGGEGPRRPPRRRGGGGDEHGLMAAMGDMAPLFTYHAYSAANWLAMHATRHMHLYGTTREQFGWLAVNSRRNAALNDHALYRDPITLDDYFAARPVSDPFSLLDCDVPVDGSIAVVVSAAGYAPDCPNPPVHVEAMGGVPGFTGGWYLRPDYPVMASADAAREMWSRTDLTPADVDAVELYDGFTFLTFDWLEALGFCARGESGPFVEGAGRIALDGALPVNTYGGQLSAGRMHGYWVLHEACVQLRGQAGARQVPNAEVVAVSNGGGPIAGCMLLTR
jgi:acetyl-CoA acetyltransferase